MTRRLALLLLVAACERTTSTSPPIEHPPAVARPAAPLERRVDYRLSPVIDEGELTALAVELRFVGEHSGSTMVMLPKQWASETELWKYVRDVQVEGAIAIEDDGAALRTIRHEPDAPLVMRYRIVSAYDHEPTANDGQPFAPIVRPRWFYAFGEALFAEPSASSALPASFTWTGAPEDFAFVSDLQQLDANATVQHVLDSIALGGRDTKLYTETVGDAEIRIGIHGKFAFEHAAFAAMSRSIIAVERDFWGEHGEPFTIAMAPLVGVKGSRSLGGTGRTDGFTILMSDDASIAPVRHLIAHEYFHTWNADRLGGQQDGTAEMLGKWFSEGFTEFYTWRLLLHAGIYTLDDYVADWNSALREYASSPAKNVPNTRIAEAYWTDPAVGKLPYRRGPLLAAIWDQRLRRATDGAKNLDDVLHAMRKKIRDAGDTKLAPDAATLFLSTYVEQGGPDLSADVTNYIENGETIVLPAHVFGHCLRVANERKGLQQLRIVKAKTDAEKLACARALVGE